MRKKEFFKNLGTILVYALLGTFISIVFIGFSMWMILMTGLFGQVIIILFSKKIPAIFSFKLILSCI